MEGFWLASYLLLWGLVGLLALLVVGMLRQLGELHLKLGGPASVDAAHPAFAKDAMPPLALDGPELGSPLPEWAQEISAMGDGGEDAAIIANLEARDNTLLMFLSPLCETCQHVVEPLNELAADTTRHVHPAAVIRADRQAYEAFLNVFPLHLPTLRDHDRTLTMELGVHRSPFGLLYDHTGTLIRKGLIESREDLLALVDDADGADDADNAAHAKIIRRAIVAVR